jgi:hypothetical protein
VEAASSRGRWRAVRRRAGVEAHRRTGAGRGAEDDAAGAAPGSGHADWGCQWPRVWNGCRWHRLRAAAPRSGHRRPAGEGGGRAGRAPSSRGRLGDMAMVDAAWSCLQALLLWAMCS